MEKSRMKIIFDLRNHPTHAIVRSANEALVASNSPYLQRYGAIGSEQWWQMYEAGTIFRSKWVGKIIHLGLINDFEVCDIVRLQADQGDIEYDRRDFWLDTCVAMDKWVHIEKIEIVIPLRLCPTIYEIHVQVGVEDNIL
jgi:hypothetical protein